MSILEESFSSIHKKLHNKELKVSDIVEASFARIQEVDDKIKAFVTVNEEAREHAKKLDEALDKNETRGLLFGLPVGLKDNLMTEGMKTTSGSRMLENFVPTYSAAVVHKLAKAEAVMMGKLNMDEFAMGSSNETSYFHPTYNPWNTDYVPGGSSGGSAAAVAAGEVSFALGTDTGGSIRQPAAYCGVVGMKPTYGRVSRDGLIAFASSLDQIGPITRTVEDNALVLGEIAGQCQRDPMTAAEPVPDYLSALTGDVKGLRIAVPKEFLGEGVADDVKASVKEALQLFEKLGASIEEVSLPHAEYAVSAYYVLAAGEASASLARFDGVRYGYRANATNLQDLYDKTRSEGFGDEVKRRILFGTFALSTGYYDMYYKKAQQVRTLIKKDFDDLWESYDVIIGPTTPTTAFKVGEKVDDPMTMYANDILTIPVSLAGVPSMSVPCGFSNGLPIGLQIIAKPFAEDTIYRTAHAFEQETDYHKRTPEL